MKNVNNGSSMARLKWSNHLIGIQRIVLLMGYNRCVSGKENIYVFFFNAFIFKNCIVHQKFGTIWSIIVELCSPPTSVKWWMTKNLAIQSAKKVKCTLVLLWWTHNLRDCNEGISVLIQTKLDYFHCSVLSRLVKMKLFKSNTSPVHKQ